MIMNMIMRDHDHNEMVILIILIIIIIQGVRGAAQALRRGYRGLHVHCAFQVLIIIIIIIIII